MMKIISIIKNNKTLTNGSLFAVFSFFNQGVSFVLLIILANFIAPAEYGQLSLFNTVVMFIGYFAVLSSDGFLSISYFRTTKEEFSRDVSSVLCVLGSMCLILLLIVTIGGEGLAKVLKLPQNLLYIAVAVSSLHVLVNINLNIKRVKENLKGYGLLSCGFALLNFALSLLLVCGADMNWLGRIYAQLLCTILFGTIAVYSFFKERYFTRNLSSKRIKEILLWGIPLIPHLATTWLRQGCDRYIIDAHFTLTEVGLFSFALNLSNVVEMVGHSFNATNSVSIYKTLSNEETTSEHKINALNKLTKEMFLIYIVATVFILLGVIFLVPMVMPKYNDSIPYFIVLAVYGFLRCVYFIYCNYLFYWGKNKNLMYITITFAVTHLLLSLIFTKYSLFCTAAIYVLTQLMIDIVVIIIARKLIIKKVV